MKENIHELQLPNILVVAQNRPQNLSGGGVVLSNLFDGYSASCLKFIHRDHSYNLEDRNGEYRVSWWWLRFNIPKLLSDLRQLIQISITDATFFNLADLRAIFQQSSHFYPPNGVMREINLFRPEVIYTWASDAFWAKSVTELARNLDCPYVIHFMDNHLEKTSKKSIEEFLFSASKAKIYDLSRRAKRVLAISDSMAAAYSKIFECPVDVFRGAIDASEWPKPKQKIPLDTHVTIGYVGSIEKSQIPSLIDLIDVVGDLNKDSACRIEIVLYLTDNYKKSVRQLIKERRFVSIVDHPSFSDLRRILGELDLLVSLYGFGADSISYYKYSFATKIVPYMLSGTPILVYGPAQIEPVNYARLGEWSILIDTRSKNLLSAAIQNFIYRPQNNQAMVLKAWEKATKNHNLKANALRFQSVLRDVSLNRPNMEPKGKRNEK